MYVSVLCKTISHWLLDNGLSRLNPSWKDLGLRPPSFHEGFKGAIRDFWEIFFRNIFFVICSKITYNMDMPSLHSSKSPDTQHFPYFCYTGNRHHDLEINKKNDSHKKLKCLNNLIASCIIKYCSTKSNWYLPRYDHINKLTSILMNNCVVSL